MRAKRDGARKERLEVWPIIPKSTHKWPERLTAIEDIKNYYFDLSDRIITAIQYHKEDTGQDMYFGSGSKWYFSIKEIWDTDISEYSKTIELYDSMVSQFMNGWERSINRPQKVHSALIQISFDYADGWGRSIFKPHKKPEYIELGYLLAMNGDLLTFGNFVFTKVINGALYVNDNEAVSKIDNAPFEFDWIANGFAIANFKSFLEKIEKELESGGDTTEEKEPIEKQTATEGYVYLDELGIIQHFRAMNDISNESKIYILSKILGISVRTAKGMYNNEEKYYPKERTVEKVKDKLSGFRDNHKKRG